MNFCNQINKFVLPLCLLIMCTHTYAEPLVNSLKADKTEIELSNSAANKLKIKQLHLNSTIMASVGFEKFRFNSLDDKSLPAYTYRASKFNPLDGPIWFVMHGAKRNAEHYLNVAAPLAEKYQALVIAIEFSRQNYPKGKDYTLGISSQKKATINKLNPFVRYDQDTFLYAEIERVFDATRRVLGGKQLGYYLFGHSAGAQFTHRLITFMPKARVLGAVAANAGWYTLPSWEKGANFLFPYGLKGSPLPESYLQNLLNSPLTLLLGSLDITTPATDPLVRGTPEAMAQGENRLVRGINYFNTGKRIALLKGLNFNWKQLMLPGAGHQVRQMIASAGYLLFSPEPLPCKSSHANDAGMLIINEILADPPKGDKGDTNGDGKRDALSDEFIEIVNTDLKPICLTGWTLSDSTKERHLFPIGDELMPGKAIVIFGGGVPTGNFGNSNIQNASSSKGLSLSSKGDVLSLKDAFGNLAKQISWGDCGHQQCSIEHINKTLDFSGSIVRWPELEGDWHIHRDIANTDFSPGRRANDSNWQ